MTHFGAAFRLGYKVGQMAALLIGPHHSPASNSPRVSALPREYHLTSFIIHKALKELTLFNLQNTNLLPFFPSVVEKQLLKPSFCSLNMPTSFLPQGHCTCSSCLECCLHCLHTVGSFWSFRPQVKCVTLREPFATILICDVPCPSNF